MSGTEYCNRFLTPFAFSSEFGGIKRGGGQVGAAFDTNGDLIKCANALLNDKRKEKGTEQYLDNIKSPPDVKRSFVPLAN